MLFGIVLQVILWTVLFISKTQFTEGQCPHQKKIVVLYRSYFDYYLAKNTTPLTVGSNESDPTGLFPKVFRDAVARSCGWIEVNFVPLPESYFGEFYRNKDIETLAWMILHNREYRSGDTLIFLFPVFANKGIKMVFLDSFKFIALTRSGGHAVMMRTSDYKSNVPVWEILLSFVSMFSMLTILAFLVGTVVWFLEHRNNRVEFPAPFVLGVFEGFWWSIVTMTTVGYGDKSPKSRITRVLAFAWMVYSAIFVSLFTANASSLMTLSRNVQYDKTLGHNIGVLHSKAFVESEMSLGAYIKEYYNQSSLTDALLEKEVDRILFPNYLDYLFHLRIPQFRKKFKSKYKIATVMHKPFDIGFAAISYHEWASANDAFFGSLEFHISRSEKELKWNYSGIAHDDTFEIQNGFSYAWDVSLVCLIILGCFIVLGVAFDVWKYFKNGSNDVSCSPENREPERPSENKDPRPITREGMLGFETRTFP